MIQRGAHCPQINCSFLSRSTCSISKLPGTALLICLTWGEAIPLFDMRVFFSVYLQVWICYSRIKCPSNCLWHMESPSCGCHSASSFKTLWTKCPYTCPWPPWPIMSQISDKTSEKFVIFILLLILFKVPLKLKLSYFSDERPQPPCCACGFLAALPLSSQFQENTLCKAKCYGIFQVSHAFSSQDTVAQGRLRACTCGDLVQASLVKFWESRF